MCVELTTIKMVVLLSLQVRPDQVPSCPSCYSVWWCALVVSHKALEMIYTYLCLLCRSRGSSSVISVPSSPDMVWIVGQVFLNSVQSVQFATGGLQSGSRQTPWQNAPHHKVRKESEHFSKCVFSFLIHLKINSKTFTSLCHYKDLSVEWSRSNNCLIRNICFIQKLSSYSFFFNLLYVCQA